MKYLIEKNGERQYVDSLEHYEGWTVLGEGAAFKPVEHGAFINGAWVVDQQKKTRAERRALLLNMDREELLENFFVEKLRDRFKALTDRVTALETEIAALKAPSP